MKKISLQREKPNFLKRGFCICVLNLELRELYGSGPIMDIYCLVRAHFIGYVQLLRSSLCSVILSEPGFTRFTDFQDFPH